MHSKVAQLHAFLWWSLLSVELCGIDSGMECRIHRIGALRRKLDVALSALWPLFSKVLLR